MGDVLTISWVERFIARRFPDPEPNSSYVRAYRTAASLVFSAALLNSGEPRVLRQFTGYSLAFVAAVAWNMSNNGLWSRSGYESSRWLSSAGELNDRLLIEDIDIALGQVWVADAEFPDDSIDCYAIYRDVSA